MKNNNAIYIISISILFIIWIVLFWLYIVVNNLLAEAKNNVKDINISLISTINNYKIKGQYDINNYNEISYVPIYTKKWELYAEIIPEDYKSYKEYNINSNEVSSLLYIEDKWFLFRDLSFSLKWLLRAIYNIHFKWIKQWWSWITQQLVKNVVLNDDTSSLSRKYKELIVSYYIENDYSKTEVINSYLNQISYWKNIYWIQKAWELYLWKEELKLEDCFLLNAMLKQPSYYYKNQEKLKVRAIYYLESYLKDNWIDEERIKNSIEYINSTKLEYRNHNKIYWWNNYIIDKVKQYLDTKKVKKVTLNYDIDINKEKEINLKIKAEENKICEKYQACDIGIVVINSSWTIDFLYWWNYEKSQVDSTSSLFELWSTLKPFIYAKYFDLFWTKESVDNSKICIWDYCPNNWDNSYNKSISFSKAINLSYNLPVMHIAKNYLNLNDLNSLFIILWLYKENDKKVDYTMVLWTKQSTLLQLTNAYYSLFDWSFKKITLFNNWEIINDIFSKKSINYINKTLTNNWFDKNYSIKTWTSSDFKDNYIIAHNNKYIIWIWMWNKDWSKTLKNVYSMAKWSWLLNILKEYYK
jgi:membrane peptidoglycan carboxypeptidase